MAWQLVAAARVGRGRRLRACWRRRAPSRLGACYMSGSCIRKQSNAPPRFIGIVVVFGNVREELIMAVQTGLALKYEMRIGILCRE